MCTHTDDDTDGTNSIGDMSEADSECSQEDYFAFSTVIGIIQAFKSQEVKNPIFLTLEEQEGYRKIITSPGEVSEEVRIRMTELREGLEVTTPQS